jgi:hypothetical protein
MPRVHFFPDQMRLRFKHAAGFRPAHPDRFWSCSVARRYGTSVRDYLADNYNRTKAIRDLQEIG